MLFGGTLLAAAGSDFGFDDFGGETDFDYAAGLVVESAMEGNNSSNQGGFSKGRRDAIISTCLTSIYCLCRFKIELLAVASFAFFGFFAFLTIINEARFVSLFSFLFLGICCFFFSLRS